MFFTLESKPRFTNCPRCQSTNTFLSLYKDARFCVSCNKTYNRTDEASLREQKIYNAKWTVYRSNGNVTALS
jgi:transposase-like protein